MYTSLSKNVKTEQLFKPQTVTADQNTASTDLSGFNSLLLIASVGLSGDTLSGSVKIEYEVEHSDNNSTWVDCADADLIDAVAGATNTGTFAVVNSAATDETVYKASYIGGKRYVRVVINVTGTHTNGTPQSIIAVKGDPVYSPAP